MLMGTKLQVAGFMDDGGGAVGFEEEELRAD
jgi:hypothetical protein